MYFDEPAPAFAETKEPVGSALILASALFVSPLGYLAIPWLGQAPRPPPRRPCSEAHERIGWPCVAAIRTVAETGSTNDDVAALARDGAAEGLWLRAERQTGGKGRQGRAWQSPPAISTPRPWSASRPRTRRRRPWLWSPPWRCTRRSPRTRRRARIKWPNDMLVNGAKLAGILLERQGDAVIIGFGVNLAHHPETSTARPRASPRPASTARARAGLPRAARRLLRRLAGALAGQGLAPGPRRLARRRPPRRHGSVRRRRAGRRSTASTRPARCACASPTARCASSMPATSS